MTSDSALEGLHRFSQKHYSYFKHWFSSDDIYARYGVGSLPITFQRTPYHEASSEKEREFAYGDTQNVAALCQFIGAKRTWTISVLVSGRHLRQQ